MILRWRQLVQPASAICIDRIRFGNWDKHACRQEHTMDYARPGALDSVEARAMWALMRAQARRIGRLNALGRVLCRA